MRLEQALEEYDRRRERAAKEAEKLRKKYNKRLEKRIKELLKMINELEKKKIPKDVDGNIRKIVTAERKNYVTALRNALGSIKDMEDLGKRLPDLAKLHVGHGRYLLIIFEKEVYSINRLLKELNEEYVSYYNELAERGLEEIDAGKTLREIGETHEVIKRTEEEIGELKRHLDDAEESLKELYRESGLEELEGEIKALRLRVKSGEMEVRSKASKLQKPVKRMRLGGGIAEELVSDSSVALRKPEEFLKFLEKIEPRLEPKQRKAAKWLLENLLGKIEEINRERERLVELENRREEILKRGASLEEEIRRIKSMIAEKEAELKRLRGRLEHLEGELENEIERLERILGTKIER